MAKLMIADLKKIKENYYANQTLREGRFRVRVTVHMGTCGIEAGAWSIVNTVLDELSKAKIDDVFVKTSGCAGLCSHEPMVTIELAGESVKYISLTEDKMRKIMTEHVVGGKLVKEYALIVINESNYLIN